MPDGNKTTNPKDAVSTRKLAFSVLPWRVLTGVALAMLEGAAKYGRHNYRAAGVRASVYFDAVVGRHLTDWWEGVDIDPDSGEHHVDKAIAGLMVMRDSMYQGNFVDDRPPHGKLDMADLNRRAGEIMDRHADKSPKHYTIADKLDEQKMNQTRLGSLYEALINTVIGFSINYLANLLIFPHFGFHISLTTNFFMGLIYTFISVVRSYCIRRFFNARLHAFAQRLAGNK